MLWGAYSSFILFSFTILSILLFNIMMNNNTIERTAEMVLKSRARPAMMATYQMATGVVNLARSKLPRSSSVAWLVNLSRPTINPPLAFTSPKCVRSAQPSAQSVIIKIVVIGLN